jgi:Tfp pilus assembly protein FimV
MLDVEPSEVSRLVREYTVLLDPQEEFAFRDPYRIVWHVTAAEPAA